MSLGERCDEIVRLIDATLVDVAADAQKAPDPRLLGRLRSSGGASDRRLADERAAGQASAPPRTGHLLRVVRDGDPGAGRS